MNAYERSLKDTDRKIQSLKDQERELLERANDLRQRVKVTSATYIGNDLDVHGGITTEKFKGSDAEIKEVDAKLATVQKQIAELEKNKAMIAGEAERAAELQEARELKEKEKEEERKRREEEEKIMLFKEIKRAYTKSKGHGFDRFIAAVSGKSPKWSEIKGYDIDQLRYLDKSSRGQTKLATSYEKTTESIMNDNDAEYKEIEKRKRETKWKLFVHELSSKETLDLNMKVEGSRTR